MHITVAGYWFRWLFEKIGESEANICGKEIKTRQWERGTRKKKVEYDVLLLESRSGNVNYFVPVFGLASTADLTRVNQYVVSLYIYVGIMATINAQEGAEDSSNTYGGGDAPDRPEEAGQLQDIYIMKVIFMNGVTGKQVEQVIDQPNETIFELKLRVQFLEEIRTDALKLNFMSMSGRKLNDYETISEAGLSDGSFILWTSHTRFKLDIINHRDGEIFHQFVSITDTIGDLRREIDVSTVFFNGSPTTEFKLEKVLHQGDLLSLDPIIFVLVVEARNVVIIEAKSKHFLWGVDVGKDKVNFSHLQTDDALIMGIGLRKMY
ncbi:putative RNA-directed DNA polymerase, eukaryota, reverse transcriptase zinc-binding domain protein [Tanacetum coccineum]|uniref:RNA-directed DNA polymerase, eukaryota, reverse transcriptase zinc-binding domain protein n=1 Tax=Tanacetum coccineum TaxID=301880 RepID=A0ABQ4ZDV8_9ASTR